MRQVTPEKAGIVFVAPEDGASMLRGGFVAFGDAKSGELAHADTSSMHGQKVAAENTKFIRHGCRDRAAHDLLTAEFENNPTVFMAPAIRARSEVVRGPGAGDAMYAKVWDQIKAAK